MRVRPLSGSAFLALSLALSLATVAALTATARAEVLEMTTGDLVPGKVESLDDVGVTFLPEKGARMRIPWDAVPARCRYRLTRASLAADDAAGRVKLAKWCLEAGFHREARGDLLEAKGLGYSGTEDVDALLAASRKAEADAVLDRVDALVERSDLDAALQRLRDYLRAADPGEDADRVRSRVPDLMQRIERRDEDARQADEDRKKAEKEGKLKDWIDRTMKGADARKDDAGTAAAEGFTQLAKGNQTRARDGLGQAETKYQAARADYVRVKKVVKEGPAADTCSERIKDCDERTVEVLIRWGRLEVQNKNWKQASGIVDRGLRIDPVDRELLELRSTIDTSWIRRKASDVSNAHGHASSN